MLYRGLNGDDLSYKEKRMDSALIFQQRRRKITKFLKIIWLVAVIIGALLSAIIYYLSYIGIGSRHNIELAVFFSFFFAIFISIIATNKIYQCPNCNTVPSVNTGNGGGADINPSVCKKCGVKLK